MSKDDLTKEQALAKAIYGIDLLETCGKELLALELPHTVDSWQVAPLYEDWMVLFDALTRSLVDFESFNCKLLLNFGIAKQITVEKDHVCFFIGGSGFGPETNYYDVYYVPSDDINACLDFRSELNFEQQDGGWFAKADGDNTVFYQQIGEHLFFCAFHY